METYNVVILFSKHSDGKAMFLPEPFLYSFPYAELILALRPVLSALLSPIRADGGAIVDYRDNKIIVICEVGTTPSLLSDDIKQVATGLTGPLQAVDQDGHSNLMAPLRISDGRRLVLVMWRDMVVEPWTKQDHELMAMAVAALGALPSVNAIREPMSAWRGTFDDLTGLPRARKLVEDLPRHFARLDQDGLPGTLLVASVDGFKLLSAKYGAVASDVLLREISKYFLGMSRPTDIVARIGGDEFAIWLNNVDQFTAAERAEKLNTDTSQLSNGIRDELQDRISFSIGIATRLAGSGEKITGLLRRADRAMRMAREAGPCNWRVSVRELS
jgi:diguanylate cyclase (GGDEF)-like protein